MATTYMLRNVSGTSRYPLGPAELKSVVGTVVQTDPRTNCIHIKENATGIDYVIDYAWLFACWIGRNFDLHDRWARALRLKANYAKLNGMTIKLWGFFRPIGDIKLVDGYWPNGNDGGQYEHALS